MQVLSPSCAKFRNSVCQVGAKLGNLCKLGFSRAKLCNLGFLRATLCNLGSLCGKLRNLGVSELCICQLLIRKARAYQPCISVTMVCIAFKSMVPNIFSWKSKTTARESKIKKIGIILSVKVQQWIFIIIVR